MFYSGYYFLTYVPSPSLCWQPSPNKMQCLQQVCPAAASLLLPARSPQTKLLSSAPPGSCHLTLASPAQGWRPWAEGSPPFRLPWAWGEGKACLLRERGEVGAENLHHSGARPENPSAECLRGLSNKDLRLDQLLPPSQPYLLSASQQPQRAAGLGLLSPLDRGN